MDFKIRQKRLKKLVLEKSKQVQEELMGFETKETSLITLETLRSLNLFEWHVSKDKKVRYCLIGITKDVAEFLTVMQEGGEFGMQEHDCIEIGVVLDGHLIDVENDLLINKFEDWLYKEHQEHAPKSNLRSIYLVKFKK